MRCLLLITILASALQPAPANAEKVWRLVKTESREIAPSIHFVQKIVASGKNGTEQETLTLVFFKTEAASLRVIDQGSNRGKPVYSGLEDAMKKNNCIAGTNGGFFQENFAPLGLQIAGRKRTGTFNKGSSLLAGVLFVDAPGSPKLERRANFKDSGDISELLQSGPFLIDEEKDVKGLDDAQTANRTFILKGDDGTWALGRCSRVSLAGIARILNSSGVITETKIKSALNLDGGTSTAIWVKEAELNGGNHYKRSWKQVRNFIGIVRK